MQEIRVDLGENMEVYEICKSDNRCLGCPLITARLAGVDHVAVGYEGEDRSQVVVRELGSLFNRVLVDMTLRDNMVAEKSAKKVLSDECPNISVPEEFRI